MTRRNWLLAGLSLSAAALIAHGGWLGFGRLGLQDFTRAAGLGDGSGAAAWFPALRLAPWRLLGLEPVLWQAPKLILLVWTSLCVYQIILSWRLPTWASIAGAAVYAAHSSHALWFERVTSASGLAALSAGFAALAAHAAWRSGRLGSSVGRPALLACLACAAAPCWPLTLIAALQELSLGAAARRRSAYAGVLAAAFIGRAALNWGGPGPTVSAATIPAFFGASSFGTSLAVLALVLAALGLRTKSALAGAASWAVLWLCAGRIASGAEAAPVAAAGFGLLAASCLTYLSRGGRLETLGAALLAGVMLADAAGASRALLSERFRDDSRLAAGIKKLDAAGGLKADDAGALLSLPLLRKSSPESFDELRTALCPGTETARPACFVDVFSEDGTLRDPYGALALLQAAQERGRISFEAEEARLGTARLRSAVPESKRLNDRGIEAYLAGKPDDAARLLEAAVRLDPENRWARISLETVRAAARPSSRSEKPRDGDGRSACGTPPCT